MNEYVQKAINGDKDAFTLIFLNLQNDMYNIARERTKTVEDTYDAIQETIIIVYKNIKKLKKEEALKYWIFKILINECNKIYNKSNKNKVISIEEKNIYEILSDSKRNESEQIENKISFNELLSCLNEKEKMVLTLYYENKYTSKEISEILEIKDNTVKSIIKRSKKKIQIKIKGDECYER